MTDKITTVEELEALTRVLNAADVAYSSREFVADAGHREAEPGDWFTFLARAVLAAGYRPDRPVGPDVEALHWECNCVPDFGPSHCHACSDALGRVTPWAERMCHWPARPSVTREQVEGAYQEAWADLQKRPNSKIAFGRMDALAAVLRAFTSGAITLNPSKDDDPERCPICAGLNGVHGLVHVRFPSGGGGTNKPCPGALHHRAPITDEGGVVVFWWCDTTGQRTKDCPTCVAALGLPVEEEK